MSDQKMPRVDEVKHAVVRDAKWNRSIVDVRVFEFRRDGDDFFAQTTGRAKWFYTLPKELEPHFTEPDSSHKLQCTFDPDELAEGPIAVVYGDQLIELNP